MPTSVLSTINANPWGNSPYAVGSPQYDSLTTAQKKSDYDALMNAQVSALNPGATGAGVGAAAVGPGGGDVGSPGMPVYAPPAISYSPASPGALPTTGSALTTAGDINTLNQVAQTAANAGRIPNAPGLEAQSSLNIGQELMGQLPADVIGLLGQQAAERGVGAGASPGSPNTNAAYLRALGLTSLNETTQGQADLSAALARNPAAPITDASQFVETPAQTQAAQLAQQQLQAQEAQFAAAQQQQQQQFAADLALRQQQEQLAAQKQQLQDTLLQQQLALGEHGNAPITLGPTPETQAGGYRPPTVSYSPTAGGTTTGTTPSAPTLADILASMNPSPGGTIPTGNLYSDIGVNQNYGSLNTPGVYMGENVPGSEGMTADELAFYQGTGGF